MTRHFCLNCGSALELRVIEERERECCPSCGYVHYLQHKVSAGVCIERDGRLLLVQRGIDPWRGKWYMPAGFVEVDEEPHQAAVREALEETGLIVKTQKLAGVYTYFDDPRGNGIVLLYDAVMIGGEIKETPEALRVGFFSASEIENMQFAGASADRQVLDWITRSGNGKAGRS